MQRATRKSIRTARPQHSVPATRKTPQASVVERTIALVIRAASSRGDKLGLARLPGESDDAYLSRWDEHITKAHREAEQRRQESEQREAEGVTLKGPRYEQAIAALDHINITSLSCRELAISADMADTHAAGAYLTAIQNNTLVICRYADLVVRLLESYGFGNFENEFTALTPERAAELEAEEARHVD